MCDSRDNDENNEIDFSWGTKRGRGGQNKEVQFYESFTYDGVEYSLYDSVYLYKEGEAKPYIGKLIKIWELSNKARKVKVLWFFYPSEISNYLIGENVLENELFLASGVGKGLANVNPLETISGKCNVVCISKDERNRQASNEEVKMAHYVFYRTFDVQNHTISDKLDERIAMIEVKFLLNKNDFQSLDLHMVDSGNVAVGLEKSLISVRDTVVEDGAVVHDASMGSPMVKGNKGAKSILDKSKGHPLKKFAADGPDNPGPVSGMKRKLINEDQGGADEVVEYDDSAGSLLVKNDKAFEGKGDAAGHDNLGPVSLLSTDVALDSCKNIRLGSPDFKQKDMNEKCVAISSENRATQNSKIGDTVHSLEQNARNGPKPVDSGGICFVDSVPPGTAADNREKDLGKDDQKAISVGLILKSEDKQSKKLKIGGSAQLSSDNDGTSSLKVATVLTNNASKSVVAETESQDRGRLTKEFSCISDGFSKKLKSKENSSDKLHGASLKQPEDKQGSAAIYVAAKKPSQSTHGNAETDDKSKVNRQMIGTSNGISKKLKSNIKVEDKSNDKIIKVEDKSNGKLHKVRVKDESKEAEIGAHGHVKEVTQRPLGRSKWFTARPWEERMKEACDQGRLVLLHNLDPTYASSDVENIVWHGFRESCTAKVVQHTATSCQHSGQAFIICKTREAADKIVTMLDQKCLMLPNGRPVLGCREEVRFPGKHSSFPGHLVLDKLRHQMQRESREAVSTSHSSQPNTIEYEMALEWRLLQDRSELCWKMMYKKQAEEIKKLKASMKPKRASAR